MGHLDEGVDEVVEVTRRLVAAPSENPPGDERAVADVVTELLRERGIESATTIASAPSRPNVLARLDGAQPGPTLMLCGHIDTKPAGPREGWSHDPFLGVVEDGRLYGLGASDMKGGVASIVVALGRLRSRGTLRRGSVVAAFTADEEAGSKMGARFLATSGYLGADAAIIAEPAGVDRDWQSLYLGTRGSLLFRVDVAGATGHSSLEDHTGGVSATMAAARLMIALDDAFRQLPGVAVNVGATFEGGMHYGVRAGSASFRGDVRVPPAVTLVEARRILTETVESFAASHESVRASIVLDELPDGPFDPLSVDSAAPIVAACRAAALEVLGHAPPDGVFPGGTDSFFLQGIAGIPTVPALGPGRLREAHRPNEFVSLASLGVAPELLVRAAELFLNHDKGGPR
jgi:acetylornithine deacetylase/succinyl-diaminopimelate desuccinylase-like protein